MKKDREIIYCDTGETGPENERRIIENEMRIFFGPRFRGQLYVENEKKLREEIERLRKELDRMIEEWR